MKTTGLGSMSTRILVSLALSFFTTIAIAKWVGTVTISRSAPRLDIVRQTVAQNKFPSWPVTVRYDRGAVAWTNAVGGYLKVNITGSVQWLEENFISLATGGGGCLVFCSPLIIDTARNGFIPGKKGVGVYFDNYGDGTPEHMQWVASGTDDAFLVHDVGGDSIVSDGRELFGNGTIIRLTGKRADNGYDALAQYDLPAFGGNDDGVINSSDEIWEELSLWIDVNANARSESGELHSLADYQIESINIKYKRSRKKTDSAGNLLPYWTWVTTSVAKGPKKLKMADIFFVVLD